METEKIGLADKLRKQFAIRSLLDQRKPDEALQLFLDSYQALSNRLQIAQKLTEQFLDTGGIENRDPSWPEDLWNFSSGVVLIFATAQLVGRDCRWDGTIPNAKSAPPGLRTLVARAWMLRPDCASLREPEQRKTITAWLLPEADALGPTILAAGILGDRVLLAHLKPKWKRLCLQRPETPAFIDNAGRIPSLRDLTAELLTLCLGIYSGQAKVLVLLLGCAFRIGAHETSIAYSEVLLQNHPRVGRTPAVMSMRLTAFAECGRDRELIEGYGQFWLPLKKPFPYPERILYPLQKNGALELEEDLLCRLNADIVPEWVGLAKEYRARGTDRSQLSKWRRLFRENSRDESLLFGLTRCLVPLCPLPDGDLEAEVSKIWTFLVEKEGYRELAGCFLVLLASTQEEAIEQFQRHLGASSFDHPLVARAALCCLRALGASKRWDRIASVLARSDSGQLSEITSADELTFFRSMAELNHLPTDESQTRPWLQRWEDLLGLAVAGPRIEAMVGHFLNLSRSLRATFSSGDALIVSEPYQDTRFQLQRRAKAEAERLLQLSNLPEDEKTTMKDRLGRANLESTHRFLLDLAAHLPYQKETYL